MENIEPLFEFFNYEERFFWKKTFNSHIRAGASAYQAKLGADAAVIYLRSRPVARRTS